MHYSAYYSIQYCKVLCSCLGVYVLTNQYINLLVEYFDEFGDQLYEY